MKHPILVLGLLVGTVVLSAQTPTPPRAPAPAPVLSPEIHADRRVTFRLRASTASKVTVSGQFTKAPIALAKDAEGLWSVTVDPVAPGIYEYSLNVDGVAMIDPGNRDIKPMRAPRTSILEIPGEPPLPHDFQNVPHGKVSLHWYVSKSLGRRRPMQVYTPPGYDADGATRYPTLYLFHGSGDNEATWVAHGKAHWILDNLIAQGRAKKMIVVMLDGHASMDRGANTAAFERDLLEDAMPVVVANYRTREDAAHRAIIGLSMGGGQSLTVGLKHSDLFAWVGGMSSALRDSGTLLDKPDALNRQLKLLWFACGKDDSLVKANQDFDAALTQKGIRHTYRETEGAHSWPVWRKHLAEFAPLIFQDASSTASL